MLFMKELKKICFSFAYLVFVGLLLFGWYENFYGVTTKEIAGSQGKTASVASQLTGGSILEKPEKGAESYGMKNKEVPEKIMCGGTDKLIMEYLANSYATYPFSYYKEVVLNENEQKEILNIIEKITGLNEQQINHLPEDYFPAVNGNIIHFGSSGTQSENGAFSFEMGNEERSAGNTEDTKQFAAQVSYEEFQELMKKTENIIGKGSAYSMENLLQYYGLSEMTYAEAVKEYEKTIYDDKVSAAFARLFCDYMARDLGIYPVFLAVIFWLKDRRNHMDELIECKQFRTGKLITVRFLAMTAAVMIPIFVLSFESLIPLIAFSADTGIAIDVFAFLKYIIWWLLPTAMIVISLGMFLTILTSVPIAVLIQFMWWFLDTSVTALSGDTSIFTLMIRHNLLRGSELISQDFILICLNRGLLVMLSLLLTGLSAAIYNRKRDGKLYYDFNLQKYLGFFKNRFTTHVQK